MVTDVMDNSKTVTIQHVAARAGVSAMTVSRVLNGSRRVAPETRQRIEQAIEELGYVPNALAKGLLKGHTRTLGIIVGDMTNPFWVDVASGAEEVAYRNGYVIVFGDSGHSNEKESKLIHTMVSNRIDGLLINAFDDESQKALKNLVRRDYPIVLIANELKGIQADIVTSDTVYGAQVLTRHLLDLGHRRIALLNGPKNNPQSREREQGYKAMLCDYGVELRPELMVEGRYNRGGGNSSAQQLLNLPADRRPTAVIACNNFLALSVIETVRNAHLRIPEDIALVSFDDFELANVIYPFLTVIAQPARMYGVQAAQLLIDRLNNPEKWRPSRLVFTPELIVRLSCGAKSQEVHGTAHHSMSSN
jgi:LacI family transcriptional regulator